MNGEPIKRTLFIHYMHRIGDDGTIRINGKKFTFTCRQGCVRGRKMTVWVREVPGELLSLTERLLVYNSPDTNNATFIGDASYRHAV